MIYLLLFYKPIQGSSGAMHLCMLISTVDVSLGLSVYFIFRLSVQPFSGLVGDASAPTVCFLPRLAQSNTSCYLFILQGESQHLGYFLSLDSQPCLIWTIYWAFWSVLDDPFLFWCLQRLRRGVTKWSANISNRSRVRWLLCPVQSIQGYPLFLLGL